MSLGGGTFVTHNKVLPGTYINFVSAAHTAAASSDRGYVAMGLNLDWGPDNQVFTVTAEDFAKNSMKYFGYAYDAPELKGLRDLFLNATTLYAYKLNTGGTRATADVATAKYNGTRGNEISISSHKNVDDATKFDVSTYMGTVKVDVQTVSDVKELKDNDYVTFTKTATLKEFAGIKLSTGTSGTVDSSGHQSMLNKLESYHFNILACPVKDEEIAKLYSTYTKRLRDALGIKFQTVVYNYEADYEGVINVPNPTIDGSNEASAVYFVAGLEAGTGTNESCGNREYKGEFVIKSDYTQTELADHIAKGHFVMHQQKDKVKTLDDINSLVTLTDEKGDVFQSNQTIRLNDDVAMAVASLFNDRYVDLVHNDAAGRVSFWSDLVSMLNDRVAARAIEEFDKDDIVIEQTGKKEISVTYAYNVINCMNKLYMKITVG